MAVPNPRRSATFSHTCALASGTDANGIDAASLPDMYIATATHDRYSFTVALLSLAEVEAFRAEYEARGCTVTVSRA